MDVVVRDLESEGHYPAAHVHRSCLASLIDFSAGREILLTDLTPKLLKGFECRLVEKGLKWNTVSTYLRVLRSVYHRAVSCHYVRYTPLLFREVFTGVDTTRKRALPVPVMKRWLTADVHLFPPEVRKAHALFSLMFYFRGMPYIDLLHLRKQDVQDGVVSYHRHKTGRQLSIAIPAEALELMDRYADRGDSAYLFPYFIKEAVFDEKDDEATRKIKRDKAARSSYESELRKFNHDLSRVATLLGIKKPVSSYTPRHSWATTAYHRNASAAIIGGAMGHTSTRATEFYLKALEDGKIDEMNREIIDYIIKEVV